MRDFHILETPAYPNGERDPERMGRVERSAAYGAKTVTLEVTEYAEVKARSPIAARKREASCASPLGRCFMSPWRSQSQ